MEIPPKRDELYKFTVINLENNVKELYIGTHKCIEKNKNYTIVSEEKF